MSSTRPPTPPSLGSGSSPTWFGDAAHTWGGPSVLAAVGFAGEDVVIPRSDSELPGAPGRDAGARFEQLVLLGRGGMGEVWRVRDVDLNRVVAMKIIRIEAGVSEPLFARFVAEAQATAQLEHPGIVPVYELGRLPDGRVYYTMQEIRGRDLAAALTELHARSTPEQFGSPDGATFAGLLDAFRQVAETVAFAHARGVIHRDLKPANIMLGAFGEVRVVDWGLVKVLERYPNAPGAREPALPPSGDSPAPSSGGPTSAGAVAGTRGYMSPEQASGQIERLGPASDVYALGGILYAILAGRAPEESRSPAEVLASLPRVPPVLREICVRAMARRPEDRFPDAGALAAAVGRWQERAAEEEQTRARIERMEQAWLALSEGERAAARALALSLRDEDGRPSPRPLAAVEGAVCRALMAAGICKTENENVLLASAELLQRWPRWESWLDEAREEARRRAQRRRQVGLVALVLVLACGLVWALVTERRTREALTQLEAARASEQAAMREARARDLGSRAALAAVRGDAHEALALELAAGASLPEDEPTQAHLAALAAGLDPVMVFAGHQGYVYHAEWAGEDRFVTSSIDRTLRSWDATRGVELARMESEAAPVTIAVSPDGQRVAAVLENGAFELWELATGKRLAQDPAHRAFGLWTAFSPDGSLAVTSANGPAVMLWDGRTGAPLRTLDTGLEAPQVAIFSADGRLILVCGAQPSVWDVATGARVATLPAGDWTTAAFTPDSQHIVAATPKGEIELWDIHGPRRIWSEARRLGAPITYLLVTPDGEHVLAGSVDGHVMRLNVADGGEASALPGHAGSIHSMSLSADGARLYSVGTDGSVAVWELPELRKVAFYVDPSGRVPVARPSPDGRRVLIASFGGVARVWTPRALQSEDLNVCGGKPAALVASAGHGAHMVYGTHEGLCVRDLASDQPRAALEGLDVRGLAITADGGRVAVREADGKIALLDTGTGEAIWRHDPGQRPFGAAFSRGGRALILQLEDRRFRFLSAETGELLLDTPPTDVQWASLALQEQTFQPLLPVPLADGRALLLDVETGAGRGELAPGAINLYAPFAFRSWQEGREYMAGDERGVLRVWEAGKAEPLLERDLGNAALSAVAVSEDGRRLAVSDAEGVLTLLDASSYQTLHRIETGDTSPARMQFSQDGEILFLMSSLGAVSLWDVETGRPIQRWTSATPGTRAGACQIADGRVMSWDEAGFRAGALTRPTSGSQTNLRACPGGALVVPVQPFPSADQIWAPESACSVVQ